MPRASNADDVVSNPHEIFLVLQRLFSAAFVWTIDRSTMIPARLSIFPHKQLGWDDDGEVDTSTTFAAS